MVYEIVSYREIIINASVLGIVVSGWFCFIGYAVGLATNLFNDMAK